MSLGERTSVEFNNFDELYEELKKYGVEDEDNDTGTLNELRKLYDLASEIKEGCILEIGTFKGYSTAVFAVAAPTLIIHTIDPYENYPKEVREKDIPRMKRAREHAEKMWKKLGLEKIKLHNKSSLEIQPREIDKPLKIGLLFIDGDHVRDEEDIPVALKDYEKFETYVLDGGYIIFHDFNPDDPQADDKDAVNEAVKTIIERTKKQPEHFQTLAIFPIERGKSGLIRSLWHRIAMSFPQSLKGDQN